MEIPIELSSMLRSSAFWRENMDLNFLRNPDDP